MTLCLLLHRALPAAQFTVEGEEVLIYVLISENITLTGAVTSATMTVNNFDHNATDP